MRRGRAWTSGPPPPEPPAGEVVSPVDGVVLPVQEVEVEVSAEPSSGGIESRREPGWEDGRQKPPRPVS